MIALRRRVQLVQLGVGQVGGGCLLDELLVAALQRAVAGRHDDDVAVHVGQALGLDVAGVVEVALDEALAATERGDGLADRGVEQVGDLLQGAGDLQAATAAAERRLDRHRQAVLLGERDDLVGARRPGRRCRGPAARRRAARCGGRRPCRRASGSLPAAGPIQVSPASMTACGEVGVLGQEPVARVHRVGAGLRRRVEDLADVEVRLRRRAAPEGEGLVGELHVQCVAIGIGVHRHGLRARRPCRRG